MRAYRKIDFPVSDIRRFLEPGPVVLVSSADKDHRDIMTMGWHMIMEFEPSLVGCFIWDQNYSRRLIEKSKQCVINIPTADMIETVIAIGNTHGPSPDKFDAFDLTAVRATKVNVPLIAECYASFECKLVDTRWIRKYSVFILQCVKAHVATSPKYPRTIHYRGDGVFMISGKNIDRHKLFKPEML